MNNPEGKFKAQNYYLRGKSAEDIFGALVIKSYTTTAKAVLDTPNGSNGWFNGGKEITLTAPTGYAISASTDKASFVDGQGNFVTTIKVDNTSNKLASASYYLKCITTGAENGAVTDKPITTDTYKVDQEGPTVNVTGNPAVETTGPVTLAVTASDTVSGIPTAPNTAYSFDGGTTWGTETSKSFDSNQTVNIWVRDNAGNITKQSIVIDKIKTQPYTITATPGKPDFGTAFEGYTQPAAQTITIKNTGNTALVITTPASTTSYTVDASGTAKTLDPQGETTFTVQPVSGLKAGIYNTDTLTVTTDQGTTAAVTPTFTVQAITLSSIAVTTPPNKTEYTAGESFDPTVMVVTATYSDGHQGAVTGYTYSPDGPLTTADNEITISYTEGETTVTAKQPITVKPSPAAPVILTATLNNGVVNAAYSGQIIALGDELSYSVKNGTTLPAGLGLDEKSGTITGTPTAEGTTSFTLVVTNTHGSTEQALTIVVDQTATVTTHTITASLNDADRGTILPAGDAEGKTTVDDGNSQSYIIKANEGYRLSDILIDDQSIGTIPDNGVYTFTDVKADHTITGIFSRKPATVELERIAITTEADKLTYNAGENFDKTGMVVTAYYNDDTEEIIDTYTIDPAGALPEGTMAITVSYTKGSITKEATQAITVTVAPEPDNPTTTVIENGSSAGGNTSTGTANASTGIDNRTTSSSIAGALAVLALAGGIIYIAIRKRCKAH